MGGRVAQDLREGSGFALRDRAGCCDAPSLSRRMLLRPNVGVQDLTPASPNHHAMFELRSMTWEDATIKAWTRSEWVSQPLALDKHLATALS